jgi:hypothetical protein
MRLVAFGLRLPVLVPCLNEEHTGSEVVRGSRGGPATADVRLRQWLDRPDGTDRPGGQQHILNTQSLIYAPTLVHHLSRTLN